MQFVLSKLIALFLSPANWLIAALAAWLLVRKPEWKRRVGYLALIIAFLFSNPYLFRAVCLAWQPAPVAVVGNYSAAILPGGLSGYDRNKRGYFGPSADRFIQTANLYHQGLVNYILVTGGNGHLNRSIPPESIFIKEQMIKNGIPANRIITEEKSRNTRENALYSKGIVDSMHLKPAFLLITSAIHMRRCQLEFKKAGLETIAVPCNYEVIDEIQPWFNYIWPDLSLYEKWGRLMKELTGYVAGSFH